MSGTGQRGQKKQRNRNRSRTRPTTAQKKLGRMDALNAVASVCGVTPLVDSGSGDSDRASMSSDGGSGGPGHTPRVTPQSADELGSVRGSNLKVREDPGEEESTIIGNPQGQTPTRTKNHHGPNPEQRPPAPGSKRLGPATLQEKCGQARYGAGDG
ncbi:hypothetical protein NDU88_009607 [Pleurodeles waltl]|uniref:Uncharacterized protein n=1 Tax=Pleurodeles waltl TaxID=8319 RepID=A0AAV7PXP0_PLEWA|nr:hypothetical protein NDU88_009607 [Pleurodeles waltl]